LDLNKDGRVHVGIRKCKVPKVVLMHGVDGIENCLIITIIYLFELFEQQTLLPYSSYKILQVTSWK
jgi:hypothetical protein